MDIRNIRALHSRAGQMLSGTSREPKKIVLWYTLVSAAVALLFTVLTAVLTDRIADTGGLSNIGLRSVLSTGQTILPIVQLCLTACLGLGYHMAVLRIARGEAARPETLLEGFRHFGPILRATVFQGLVYLGQGLASMYLSAFIFLSTPYAQSLYQILEPMVTGSGGMNEQLVLDDATLMAVSEAMIPMLWIMAGLFLLLFVPTYFGYRMTAFCVAEDPRRGALAAMRKSKLLLRRNKLALLRLDLSMWWYYGLLLVTSLICYGDLFLAMLGVQLPWNGTVSYYGFFVLSLILQIVTYYYLMNRVHVSYALAYDGLQEAFLHRQAQKPNFPFPTEY